MKIKEGFILRKVADADVVIPIGNNIANFNGVITLNETATFLWNFLKVGTEVTAMVEAIVKEFQVNMETALEDIETFTDQLKQANMLEDNS